MPGDKSTSTILYTVTNRPGPDQTRQVSLSWNQLNSEAAFVVDLVNYPITFTLPQGTPLGSSVTLATISTQVDFAAAQDAQNLACWIVQNVAPEGTLTCPPPKTGVADPSAPSAERQTTVAFCVTAGGDRVALTWDANSKLAYYAVTLADVQVAAPSPLKEGDPVTRQVTVQRRVPLGAMTVATDLACWIADSIILDKPITCVDFAAPKGTSTHAS